VPIASAPSTTADSLSFHLALTTPKRLHVIALDNVVVFAGMSRAVTTFGPSSEYLNQIYELDGNVIRRSPKLQKGIWEDFQIITARGPFPNAAELVGTNFANTAWESVRFVWDAQKQEWDTGQNGGRPWPGGRIIPPDFTLQPSADALGIPNDLLANTPGEADVLIVAPRDIYALPKQCEPDNGPCRLIGVRQWCAPRPGFETLIFPTPLDSYSMIGAPGVVLFYGPTSYVVRDGVLSTIALPETVVRADRFLVSGGFLWYLGSDGLYRLQHAGFTRVLTWSRGPTGDRVTLEGAKSSVALTGLVSRGDGVLVTTWDGSKTQVWSTSEETLKL
jgi:hypothetical protein